MSGPDFDPEQVKVVLVVRELYGMKSPRVYFRAFLSEYLYALSYRQSIADPDVWMRPSFKPGGFMYYEYVLFYIYDVLCIIDNPLCTMKGIQAKFKLKGDKLE